nr:RecName: Full=53 kDa cell wall protein [Phaseolus vulgaris]
VAGRSVVKIAEGYL